jgi:hypothetical protein
MRRGLPPNISHRLYLCARCRVQVRLCLACDRGNQYCFNGCAQAARRASLRRAGQRYQNTEAGRAHHAARHQRYLMRRSAKMTHQGSAPTRPPSRSCSSAPELRAERESTNALSTTNTLPASGATASSATTAPRDTRRCCGCGREVSPFSRRHYQRTRCGNSVALRSAPGMARG